MGRLFISLKVWSSQLLTLQVKEMFKQFKTIILNQEKDIEAKLIQKYNIDEIEGSKSSRVGDFLLL